MKSNFKILPIIFIVILNQALAQNTFELIMKSDSNDAIIIDNTEPQEKNRKAEPDESDILFVQNLTPPPDTWQSLVQKKDKNYQALEEALQNGSNINQPVIDGQTLLHLAGMQNNLKLAEFGLSHAANMISLNKNGDTPLHWAATGITPQVMQIVILNLPKKDATTALNKLNKDGRNTLHFNALYYANPEITKMLLENQVNPNAPDKNGQTPLHYALALKKWDVAELLIKAGGNLSARDKEGIMAEDYLVERGTTDGFIKLYPYLLPKNKEFVKERLATMRFAPST